MSGNVSHPIDADALRLIAGELPPAELLKAIAANHLAGCRCKWQLRPRTGWVRLNTEPRCPHHDPKYRAAHLEETLRRLIPRDSGVAADRARPVILEIHALIWGPS
jgi:hypothetical protein